MLKEELLQLSARDILEVCHSIGFYHIDLKSILINRIIRFCEQPITSSEEVAAISSLVKSKLIDKNKFRCRDVVFYTDLNCFCLIESISYANKPCADLSRINNSGDRRMLDKFFNVNLSKIKSLKDYFINQHVFYKIGGINDLYEVTNVFGKELEITHLTKSRFKTIVQYTAVTLCDENVTCSPS